MFCSPDALRALTPSCMFSFSPHLYVDAANPPGGKALRVEISICAQRPPRQVVPGTAPLARRAKTPENERGYRPRPVPRANLMSGVNRTRRSGCLGEGENTARMGTFARVSLWAFHPALLLPFSLSFRASRCALGPPGPVLPPGTQAREGRKGRLPPPLSGALLDRQGGAHEETRGGCWPALRLGGRRAGLRRDEPWPAQPSSAWARSVPFGSAQGARAPSRAFPRFFDARGGESP